MNDPLLPDGVRLLRQHLIKTKQSISAFCEAHDLERIQVQRYLKGGSVRPSVDFAWSIERATDGEVPWHSWRSATRRATPANDLRPARKPRRPRTAA